MLDRLVPEVIVDVSPEVFTFTGPKQTVQYQTFLYATILYAKPRIVGIGEEIPEASLYPDVFRVNLFTDPGPRETMRHKMWLLEGFLRLGIFQVVRWVNFYIINPRVRFTGANTLEPVLCGYQESLLAQVIQDIGISQVTFSPQAFPAGRKC